MPIDNMKESKPKISIIILNWNQKDLTVACLSSLLKVDYSNYEVIVIDNVSTDDSCEAIKKHFPTVRLIKSEKNLGITDSRNIGVDHALSRSADYIMFLDNDTNVHKDILTELIFELEKDHRIAAATPKIYCFDDRNRIWAMGGYMNFYKGRVSLLGYKEMDLGQYDSSRTIEIDHAIGCCLMIRSRVIRKIGKLDTDSYYGEDTEFCIRAQRAGYKIVAIPKAIMWHMESYSWADNKNLKYIRSKSVLGLMRKHAKFHHWSVFCFYALFSIIKILASEGTKGDFKTTLSRIKGAFDGMQT